MEFPENISSLTVEEIRNLKQEIETRIEELQQERKDTSKTVSELVANKEELSKLHTKIADLDLALIAVDVSEEQTQQTSSEEQDSSEETTEDKEQGNEESEPESGSETQETENNEDNTIKVETDTSDEETKPEEQQTSEETSENEETVEETKEEEEEPAVEETAELTNGEDTVADDINQATESTEETAYIAAAFRPVVDGVKNDVEAVEKVRVKNNGGEAFSVRYETDGVVNNSVMNKNSWTELIMSLGTPGREGEMSFAQKQYSRSLLGKVDAAFCAPPQRLDADIQCGSYERTLGSRLPSFMMDGLEVEYFEPMDASDPDYVGEVDLDASVINKSCYEATCPESVTRRAKEIKACLQSNEQTAFTSPQGIQALLRDGEALLAAKADELLLDQIIDETYKFEYESNGAGYAEIAVFSALTRETLERQSVIHQVDNLVPIVPKSLFSYAVADNAVRQFSLANAQEAAADLFDGLGFGEPIVIDDALDITNDEPVPVLSKVSAITPNFRSIWNIHLIDPADAFIGRRNENDYSIEPVAQSINEKRANRLSWYARQYELFGRRGCSPWATMTISGLCLGGRVIASAPCIGGGSPANV